MLLLLVWHRWLMNVRVWLPKQRLAHYRLPRQLRPPQVGHPLLLLYSQLLRIERLLLLLLLCVRRRLLWEGLVDVRGDHGRR